MSAPFTLTIPCVDTERAEAFATYLRDVEELDGLSVEDRNVLVPCGGDPMFLFGVAEQASDLGYAHDDEATAAVCHVLTSAGFR